MKAFVNAKIVTPETVIENGVMLIDKGRIAEVGKSSEISIPADCEIIDAGGCYAGPGLVDIHCHGGDQYEAYEEPAEMAAYHLSHGTTSLTESIAYNVSYEKTIKGIDLIRKAMEDPNSSINGIFMEGPFNNPNFGASSHSGRPISKSEYEAIYDRAGNTIRQWMYSPELENADEFGRFIVSKGISLAIGHTCASPAQIKRAVEIGASICTHLFDAMGCHLGNETIECTGIIQDTVVDAALVTDELFLELICDYDAVHVKPSNIKLAYKCGGPDRVVLMTDCVKRFPGTDITKDININEANELSGSFLTMDKALKNMYRYTNAPITDLFKMASSNAAKAVKIFNEVGSLEKGKCANVVLLDSALDLKKVFFKGELISRK